MRNTAPCILYAALKIHNQNPDAVMLVAPSDHWIENETEFLNNIKTSFEASANNNILMTLGIQPNSPNILTRCIIIIKCVNFKDNIMEKKYRLWV